MQDKSFFSEEVLYPQVITEAFDIAGSNSYYIFVLNSDIPTNESLQGRVLSINGNMQMAVKSVICEHRKDDIGKIFGVITNKL